MIFQKFEDIDLSNFPVIIFGSGPAGITTALEIAMDDPDFQAKHPKAADALQKILGFMSKIGGDVSKGIK